MRLIDADKIQGDYFLEIHSNYIDDYAKGFQAGLNVVSNAPTIDAVPVKHGKWTPIVNVYGRLEGWLHIECGRQTNEISNYCPNCGAKMDGEV